MAPPNPLSTVAQQCTRPLYYVARLEDQPRLRAHRWASGQSCGSAQGPLDGVQSPVPRAGSMDTVWEGWRRVRNKSLA
ncbi:hypothetical protein PABY_11700 [Pyrodictium abyssi]|uniref:Uncharacterized protein n=1 Tax=Pyrodictium abyssi TaxID=54256 RepID=A0ABM8IY97_9CREN|nr:hypothetical protein PABY_11700 [Pyrodictium abyssi]